MLSVELSIKLLAKFAGSQVHLSLKQKQLLLFKLFVVAAILVTNNNKKNLKFFCALASVVGVTVDNNNNPQCFFVFRSLVWLQLVVTGV